MVNYSPLTAGFELDSIFHALSDPTRRDMLSRLTHEPLTVTKIAQPYAVSLAAISKHLTVLEKASLIQKHKHGREALVSLNVVTVKKARDYFSFYETFWTQQLDQLAAFLHKGGENK